jgi:hypothetical protein
VSNAESLTFIFLIVAVYLLRRKFVANNTGFFRKFLGFFRGFYEIVFIPASISMAIWREKEGLSAVSSVLFFYGLGWFIYFCINRAMRLAKEQGRWFVWNGPRLKDFKLPEYQPKKINNEKSLFEIKHKPKENDIYGTVRFKYRDFDGNITERTVDVITGKRGDKFKGYCHLREEIRTFYFSRIHGFELIDVETGEVTTPMEWRNRLQGTKRSQESLGYEELKIEHQRKTAEAIETWLRLTMPAPDVEFTNKHFALGGYFNSGNIDESKGKVEKRGGIIQLVPNSKTDYIVVNPDFGVNKTYENAIKKLQERGIEPVIISEEHWLSFVEE